MLTELIPDPLHPVIVHFPIAFGMLLPFVLIWSHVKAHLSYEQRLAWRPPLILAVLVAICSTVAVETGEDQEEIVEAVVAESALELHEEAGELFQRGSILVALVLGLGVAPRVPERVSFALRSLALVLSLAVLVPLVQAGHYGGLLVYEHGAARAYTSDVAPGAAGASEHSDPD